MRKFLLTCLRYYLKLGFFFYYKEFRVFGQENIPKNGSVVFLPNHRNMLIDPLIVGVTTDRFPTFLTRSDVFIKGLVDKLLRFLGLLPIYRIRDGYASLKRNQEIFDLSCERLAEEKGTVLLFPEGSSSMELKLRPLSKGFTRLVFHALNKNPGQELVIQPIGINYQNIGGFPDSVSIHYEPVVEAHKYLLKNEEEEIINDVATLRSDVQATLQKVVSSIPLSFSKEQRAEIKTKLIEANVDLLEPKAVAEMIATHSIPTAKFQSSLYLWFKQILKVLLILSLLPVYLLWRKVKSGMKDKDFIDTYRYSIAIFVVPFYLLALFGLVASFWGAKIAALVIACVFVIELLYIKI